jgi:predicted CoA-binding protein
MNGLEQLERIRAESSDPENPSAEELDEIVTSARTIGVVGMSRDPAKAARRVPSYMAAKGYDVIPINPNADRILGREAFDCITDVEQPVDIVLIFRPPAHAAEVVRKAARRPEKPVIWLQERILAPDAAAEARAAGYTVVQDLCIYKVHRALPHHAPREIAR